MNERPSPSPGATPLPPALGAVGRMLHGVLEALRRALEPLTRRWLGAPIDDAQAAELGLLPFEREADALISRQRIERARAIVRAALLATALLVVWAALAEVDEVTRGEARVIPSRQLQVVQSLDGGVVAEIAVKEGQVVEAGQLLLRVEEVRASAGVRESAATGLALKARVARLRALAEGRPFEPPAATTAAERAVVEDEARLYTSRQSELQAQLAVLRQQMAQRQQEQTEAQARRTAALRALELAQQELAQTRPLLATGAVSQVEILRLERETSRQRGEADQAGAQIARAQAAMGESQRKEQEATLAFRNEARRELSESQAKLAALTEGAVALADKVSKSRIVSPVRGRVQRLLANTVGGVVQPGKDIVEVVPLDDSLVLEARVAPKDIAFIRPGQTATVKFSAYDFSIYGGLEAKVENISPDTVVDEKGNAFYLVRVRTARAGFTEQLPILPGMTAEVDVLTGRKTVLSYLLKPVLKVRDGALRER
jgi:membrane fusion protein, adhesin transport system